MNVEATRRKRRIADLERTAYHEAGHAVCYLAQGQRFKYVTIKPGVDSLGHCLGFNVPQGIGYDLTPRKVRWIEQKAIILAGGEIAESFFLKRKARTGAHSDLMQTFHFLTCLSADIDEVCTLHALAAVRTRNLLLNPINWRGLQAIAVALIEKETLTGREARTVFNAASNSLLKAPDEAADLRREIAEYRQRFPFRFPDYVWRVENVA